MVCSIHHEIPHPKYHVADVMFFISSGFSNGLYSIVILDSGCVNAEEHEGIVADYLGNSIRAVRMLSSDTVLDF